MRKPQVEQPMKGMKEYYCCILLAITSLFWYLELFSPQITNGVIFLHLHCFSSTECGTDCIPTMCHDFKDKWHFKNGIYKLPGESEK